jgi:lysosomal acid lipase/cholesteryl ester hydrolase
VMRDIMPKSTNQFCFFNFSIKFYRYGFIFEEHTIVTEDHFILRMHRIYKEGEQSKPTFSPVIVQHGLFQSSGIFVLNEEDSLAFYLAEQG